MGLIFNGNTISTSGGIIKYNGNDVSKVVYNGTTVWQKSSPFYIVQNLSAKISVTWRVTQSQNCTCKVGDTIHWPTGYSYGDQIGAGASDDNNNRSCTWVSNSIDAKGCSQVYIKANFYRFGYITVGSQTLRLEDHNSGVDNTFNISGSTFTITVNIGTWSLGNQCLFQPFTIYCS